MTQQAQPRVSVLLAAYNAGQTVGAAISSVLSQTYGEVELIVVNDGSTDETLDICAAYGDKIRLLDEPNRGVAAARNRAAQVATGDYITVCDADDQLLPPAISIGMRVLQASQPKTVVTNEAFVLSSTGLAHGRRLLRGTVPRAERQRLAILERNFVGVFSLYSRSLFDDIGGFDEEMRQLEDWHLWLRAIYSGWRIAYQPVPVALYRMTTDSLSTLHDRFDVENEMLTSMLNSGSVDLSEEERRYLARRLAGRPPMELRQLGADALRHGNWRESRQIYRELAALSKENRHVRLRAEAISRIPGAGRAFSLRQQLIDRRLGRRVDDLHTNSGMRDE